MIPCTLCPEEREKREREEKKEEEKREKEREKEISEREKKERGVREEFMSNPGKEKKEPKVTCDECRSRITFEMNVAAAIEEKV